MKLDQLQPYRDVLNYLEKKRRQKHLLFGNGFSMAYDYKIFSYNALSDFIETTGDPLIRSLFQKLSTKNFELIMQQLDNFCEIAEVFTDDPSLVPKIKDASKLLKNSLLDAIKTLHPEHVFKVPDEKSEACMSFLQEYLNNDGYVFSTNYDLLLYWVLMRNNANKAIDGFGKELETDLDADEYVHPDDYEYSELRWGKYRNSQTIHYLHGTLPIFDTGIEIIKVQYNAEGYLLENINERIDNKEYPIFVTGGNGKEKLEHIMHNKYLTFCYDRLCNIEGSLITFGFNFGEYDHHIIDAINIAYKRKAPNKLFSIYIGVYSEDDLRHILEIKSKFKCKVNLYNARTVKIWEA